jgi:hypothetical protein
VRWGRFYETISAAIYGHTYVCFFYGDQCYILYPVFGFCWRQVAIHTATITRNHYYHFPTLSLEQLSLSLRSNLCSPTLLTYYILDPKNL